MGFEPMRTPHLQPPIILRLATSTASERPLEPDSAARQAGKQAGRHAGDAQGVTDAGTQQRFTLDPAIRLLSAVPANLNPACTMNLKWVPTTPRPYC